MRECGLRGAHVVRLRCSPTCEQGELCHGDNLAAKARELIGARDQRERQQRAAAGRPPPAAKTRKGRRDTTGASLAVRADRGS